MTILFDGRASIIGSGPWNNYNLGPWGETSWWAPDNVATPARNPRRCTLVPDPLGIKGQVVRSELLIADGAAIASLPSSRRSELSQTAVLQNTSTTYWMKIDTLIRSPWPSDAGIMPVTMWQIHDTPDSGDPGRGPPFEFGVEHDRWRIDSRRSTSGASCTGMVVGSLLTANTMLGGAFVVGQKLIGNGLAAGATIASFGTGTGANNGGTYNLSSSPGNVTGVTIKASNDAQILREAITSGPLSDILDIWQSWVVKITWSFITGLGSMTIWRNRRRIFEEVGPANCFNDVLGNFVAFGVYCPVNFTTSAAASRVSYSTGMVIGDAAETYLSFTGATELERVMPIPLSVG